MSIVYALVARSPDIVLSEFTEFSGNFEQNTRLLLKNIRKNTKSTVVFNNYEFHYIYEREAIFFCMTENHIDKNLAFAFLNDLRKKFLQSYEYDKLPTFRALQLKEFNPSIAQLMNYYNTNPQLTKTGELIRELNEAKEVMVENIEKLLERNEMINIIVLKSDHLTKSSERVNNYSEAINRNEQNRYYKMLAIYGLGIVVKKLFIQGCSLHSIFITELNNFQQISNKILICIY